MYKLLTIIFLLFVSSQCYSQKDTIFVNYKIGLSGSFNIVNKSNISLLNINNNLEFYDSTKHLLFDMNYVYGRANLNGRNIKLNDDLNLILNYTYLRDKRIFIWHMFRYDNIYSLDIDNRFQIGGGLGIYFIRNKFFNINLSDGIIYQFGDNTLFRNSIRLKIDVQYKIITLKSISYYQTSFEDLDDYILLTNHGASFKILKFIDLELKVVSNIRRFEMRRNSYYTVGLNLFFK